MRRFSLLLLVATLLLALISSTESAGATDPFEGVDLDQREIEKRYAQALQGGNPDQLLAAMIKKRQAAAGGGGGQPTTYTGLQTISGYTPPPSVALPSPTAAVGTIIAPSQIPGYGNSSNFGTSGSSSDAPLSHVLFSLSTFFGIALSTFALLGAGWIFV
ncbi:hypothetical protein IE53DRAFT_390482 [Violaceomyces palustris]|uniref:Uncharacterized protein n=1 Tax=Violaceomyces palustris TaxID=1673888 RepID=A0ACD0NNM9_9BASI|nr:hypothetical protein IE53DRAFT_390482 [Violaceomyces palustris]